MTCGGAVVVAVLVSGETFIERLQPVRLTCNATGRDEAPHSVDWFRDGRKLESSEERGVTISKSIEPHMLVSVLEIARSELSDTGQYVCRSSNNEHAVINIHILDGESPLLLLLLLLTSVPHHPLSR